MSNKEALIELLSKCSTDEVKDVFNQLSADDIRNDLKLLTRLPVIDAYHEKGSEKTYWGICLDVETSGLEKDECDIIELSLIAFEFDQAGVIYDVKTVYNGFEEPEEPISEQITKITGITNEMLKGHRFNDDLITTAIDKASLIIAHNAKFDRGFMEKRFPVCENKHWGCSLNDVDWEDEGYSVKKLGSLLAEYGYFFEAHRAETDVRACIHLLAQSLATTEESVLVSILDSVRTPTYHIYANNAPFEKKDLLKDREYRWHGGDAVRAKCWNKAIDESDIEDELEFLRTQIYPSNKRDVFKVEQIGSLNRYSDRPGEEVSFDTAPAPQGTGLKS